MVESRIPNAVSPADVASIDAIIMAAYDSISGPPGKRDWNRVRSLFIPGARLIPTAENAGEISLGGQIASHLLDVDGFIERRSSPGQADDFDALEPLRMQVILILHVIGGHSFGLAAHHELAGVVGVLARIAVGADIHHIAEFDEFNVTVGIKVVAASTLVGSDPCRAGNAVAGSGAAAPRIA